jgi:hypothetical protein
VQRYWGDHQGCISGMRDGAACVVLIDGGASAYGGSIPPLPTTFTIMMTIPQIIAYVRGTPDYAALSETEKQAIAAGDPQALAAVLNARIDSLTQTDLTQADSVREVLRDLNAQ